MDPQLFSLTPGIVEYLVGDYRVTGVHDLTWDVQSALNQWVFDTRRTKSLRSCHLDILPLSDRAKRAVVSYFDDLIENNKVKSTNGDLPAGLTPDEFARPLFRLQIIRFDRPTLVVQVPLGLLFSSFLADSFVVYGHAIQDESFRYKHYVGLTKQGWTSRWRQHVNAAKNGSKYLFHEAMRRAPKIGCEAHIIFCAGLSFEEAMNLEEIFVRGTPKDPSSLYPHGLNMIPGGYAGLAYLGKFGFKNIGPRQWESRSRLLREFAAHCSRESKPNPLLAARWRDDEYAKSIIFGNPNNFSEPQIAEIRYLSSLGHDAAMIAANFQCDVRRIRNVLEGSTYWRV